MDQALRLKKKMADGGHPMAELFKTVYKEGEGEIEEKKSRFIAHICPVSTEEEALAFIAKQKKSFWDARHNCYAYRIGARADIARYSDDGEPQGTAGRPMLEVLSAQGITDVCVVVTRYFGGVLLGTGGLVRAYQGAVLEGLKNCAVIEKQPGQERLVRCEYTHVGKLQYLLAQENLQTLGTDYAAQVEIRFLVPAGQEQGFEKKLTEAFSGTISSEKLRDVTFAMVDGEAVYF